MKTLTILADLKSMLDDKVAKINSKMKKFSNNELIYTCSEKRFEKDQTSPLYKHFVIDVTLEGSYKINDWEFVAVCDYHPEIGKNIVNKTPNCDLVIPSIYYTSNNCDHCGVNRFRKKTILLFNNKLNAWKQVGSACVKDYIGVNAEDYLRYLSAFSDIEDLATQTSSGSRQVEYFPVKEIIEQAIARAKRTGYISQNKSCELANVGTYVNTTASDVYNIMNKVEDDYGVILPPYNVTTTLEYEAEEVIDFIKNRDAADNEYIANLKTLIELEFVTNKELGLVVSMVGYYLREIANAEKTKNEANSQYIGEVGNVIEFTAQPECVFSADTQFGFSYIYKFNVNNNIVIWKTGKSLDVDNPITVKGRIKSLNEYRGVKQTEVTRCRVTA